MLTRQALKKVPVHRATLGSLNCKVSYNPPNAKTTISPIFCLVGRLNAEITAIGRPIIRRSVKMLNAALKNHKAGLLIQ